MGAGLHGHRHAGPLLCPSNTPSGADGSGERLHDRFRADGRLAGADAPPMSGPQAPGRPSGGGVQGSRRLSVRLGLQDFWPLSLWPLGIVAPGGRAVQPVRTEADR